MHRHDVQKIRNFGYPHRKLFEGPLLVFVDLGVMGLRNLRGVAPAFADTLSLSASCSLPSWWSSPRSTLSPWQSSTSIRLREASEGPLRERPWFAKQSQLQSPSPESPERWTSTATGAETLFLARQSAASGLSKRPRIESLSSCVSGQSRPIIREGTAVLKTRLHCRPSPISVSSY
jgi:hypothetical protein